MPQTGLGINVYVFDHAANLIWYPELGEAAPLTTANIIVPRADTTITQYKNNIPSYANTNWRLLGEPQSVETDGPQAAAVDFSAVNSFLNYKPFRRGQKDAGTLSLSLLYDSRYWPRVLQLFSDTANTGGSGGTDCIEASMRWWQIRIPGALCNTSVDWYWSCQGFAQNAPLSASGPDDPMVVDLEVKLSGPPVVQDGAFEVFYPRSK